MFVFQSNIWPPSIRASVSIEKYYRKQWGLWRDKSRGRFLSLLPDYVQLQFLCGTLNETIKPVNPLRMLKKTTRVRKSLFPYVDRLNFQVISSWQPLSRATHSYLDTTWFPRVSAQWCCKKKIEAISIESDKRRNEDDKGVKMELSKLVVKCTQTSERLKSD